MSEAETPYTTTRIDPADSKAGFSSGIQALDDYASFASSQAA